MVHRFFKTFYRQIFSNSDCIHYPTEFIRETFESVVGKTHGIIISNGVNDIFKYKPSEKPEALKDKIVILSVGRLSGEKSQAVLIRAVSESAYRDKIHLVLAGEGPSRSLVKLAKTRGVDMEVNFYPHRSWKYNNYADLYVIRRGGDQRSPVLKLSAADLFRYFGFA